MPFKAHYGLSMMLSENKFGHKLIRNQTRELLLWDAMPRAVKIVKNCYKFSLRDCLFSLNEHLGYCFIFFHVSFNKSNNAPEN